MSKPSCPRAVDMNTESDSCPPIPVPLTLEMKSRVDIAWKKVGEANTEIERRVSDYRQKLREELENRPREYWSKTDQEVGAEALPALRQWFHDVYTGKFGRGRPIVIQDIFHRIPGQLARVLAIKDLTEPSGNSLPSKEDKRESVEVFESYVVSGGKADDMKELDKQNSFSGISNYLRGKKFAEVASAGFDNEELDQFYNQLTESGWIMADILRVFPESYKPKIKVGEVLRFGSCSHHSGDIVGHLIVLPTARFAVVSEYSGERSATQYNLHGVTDNPRLAPDWSARSASWDGEDLDGPTAEELAFLTGHELVRTKGLLNSSED